MKKTLLLTMALLGASTFLQETKAEDILLTDADLNGAYATKNYANRVSVHDPSIFMDTISGSKDNPSYYIYGSHLATGKTTEKLNYQSWSRFSFTKSYTTHAIKKVKNCNGEEVTFGNFDAHEWQYKGDNVGGNEWAPDIIWNPTMQKWLMYMSVNGNHWCSSIVCLTSNSPTGPWTYQGPVVFSGFQGTYEHNGFAASNDFTHTDYTIATGETTLASRYQVGSSWGTYWPNCIDPCVFYDDDNRLWFSYGSWSGGIFLFELDQTTGLRDYTKTYPYEVSGTAVTPGSANANCTSDPYFGKKIAGGYYNSGEASYIEKIGNYYYLFMSYGGLSGYGDYFATGYQMRIFRSENPDGPYKDCLTASGRNARFTSAFTDFGSNAKYDYGVRLMSCYKWDAMPYAEIAQGHNSAIVDHKGRALVVYHTRQNNGNEGHTVRVHQLFTNQDGWLVAAPYEFSGETYTMADIESQQLYTAEEVAGDYQFIFHKYRQRSETQEYESPYDVTLNADGTVSGSCSGSWELVPGTSFINISIKGTKTNNQLVKFNGVLTKQTVDYTNIPALCFTVISSSDGTAASGAGASYVQTRGLCVWGSKADAKAAIKFTLDRTSVPFSDGQLINSNLELPTKGYQGAKVKWTTSDPTILSASGVVSSKGGIVTLTLNVSKDGYTYKRDYTLQVDKSAVIETPVYYPESSIQNLTAGWWQNFSSTYILKAGNDAQFKFYNYSSKQENYHNWALYGCKSFVGTTITGEYFGVRNDFWDNTTGSNTGCTANFDWNTFKNDMDKSLVDMNVSLNSDGLFKMSSTITTLAGKTYTYSYSKTLSDKPSQLTLFFVSEKSYISPVGPNGENVGIEEISTEPDAPAGIYDLQGRQLKTLQPGFQVVGGRKIIIR